MPFREISFYHKSENVIANKARIYFYLTCRALEENKQKKYKKDYQTALRELHSYIRENKNLHFKSIDEAMLCIDMFYSDIDIAKYIYTNSNEQYDELQEDVVLYWVDKYCITKLCDIADSLLVLRDGRLSLQTEYSTENGNVQDFFGHYHSLDKVEIWNTLTRLISPDILIATYYCKYSLKQISNLYEQRGTIVLADKFLQGILQKGIAETHQHMGVGYEYTYLWNQAMNIKTILSNKSESFYKSKKFNHYQLAAAAVFRYLAAEYFESSSQFSFENYISENYGKKCVNVLLDDMLHGIANQNSALRYSDFDFLKKKVVQKEKENEIEKLYIDKSDCLMTTIYFQYNNIGTIGENIFLLRLLSYIYENPANSLAHCCQQYLIIKNQFFMHAVQENQMLGLDYFQTIYSNASKAFRINNELTSKDKFRQIIKTQCMIRNIRKIEFRISPDFEGGSQKLDFELQEDVLKKEIKSRLLKKIQEIFEAYLEYIIEAPHYSHYEKMDKIIPNIGLIYHFIKENSIDNVSGYYCWICSKDIMQKSNHILQWQEKVMLCAEAIIELREEIPFLADYIVGIDAASIENNMEPWVFAPIYHGIRKYEIIHADSHTFTPNLGFTYHVGEDFRHILSGLRHIDEVLEHFSYRESDRLGHAIALGLDIEEWVKKNEVVIIPRFEQLENLLWIWGYKVQEHQGISYQLNILEKQILDIAKDIYGNINGITPYMLYEVYLQKFEGKFAEYFKQNKAYLDCGIEEKGANIYCKYMSRSKEENFVWNKERLLCTNFCPIYETKFREPMFVNIDNLQSKMLEELQNILIRKVATRGIYVETNPSSNIAIGEIENLSKHYIFKLNNEGLEEKNSNAVLVTINSDDPTVFNTNVENEIAYIYYLLISKGYSRENILRWIDKVREYGLNSSFIRNMKTRTTIKCEIMQMLRKIEEQKNQPI